ncbi:MAG: YitT family protein [Ignavibacteria bacterium]|jgi:uncharacterized membrane-anchored protein YitT (DUF2179 family)
MRKNNHILKTIKKYLFLELGALLAAVGLEEFLIPNNIIDGGITGISIISSYLSNLPLGIFILILNIPFLIFGYKQIGKTFMISTLFSVISLSIWVSFLRPIPGVTNDVLLATVFGGIILGIGIGIIIRFGGSLDGTEIIAIFLNKKTGFSVGEIIMFFNLFIIASAGFVFGWDRAMYSLIVYFIAYKVINITIDGMNETKAAIIISDKGTEIGEVITARLGRGVTFLEARGGFNGQIKNAVYSVVTRLEIVKLKSIINDIDPEAFMTINDVYDTMGGKHKKRNIH